MSCCWEFWLSWNSALCLCCLSWVRRENVCHYALVKSVSYVTECAICSICFFALFLTAFKSTIWAFHSFLFQICEKVASPKRSVGLRYLFGLPFRQIDACSLTPSLQMLMNCPHRTYTTARQFQGLQLPLLNGAVHYLRAEIHYKHMHFSLGI
jgi:hypothetical protein